MELGGINNLSYVVQAGDASDILRVYRTTGDLERTRAEHALLLELAASNLPFQVPLPVATRQGETLVPVTHGKQATFASLFPMVPGHHPIGNDRSMYRTCGRALGELDRALG